MYWWQAPFYWPGEINIEYIHDGTQWTRYQQKRLTKEILNAILATKEEVNEDTNTDTTSPCSLQP